MSQKRRPWKRWVLIIGIAVTSAFFFSYANKSVMGTVTPVETQPTPAVAATTGETLFEGTHVTFTYPGTYTTKEHQIDTDQYIERISLVNDEEKKKLAVALAPLKTSSFATEPAILLRRTQSTLYTENPKGLNPHGAQRSLFYRHDDDGQEYAAFWMSGGSLLTVTSSSKLTGASVAADFDLLLQTIRLQ